MPFRFRFEFLLRQREHLLRQSQIALAGAQRRHAELRSRLTQLQGHLEEQWKQWEERQHQGVEAGIYVSFRHYITHLEHQLLLLERELDKAAIEVAKRKSEMIERDTALKALEKLQDNDRELYRTCRARLEQKQLDETAVIKDARDRMGTEGD